MSIRNSLNVSIRKVWASEKVYLKYIFFISNTRVKLAKTEANAKQHSEDVIWKFFTFSTHVIRQKYNFFILKSNQKNKCVCVQEMTCIIIMKRMKNGPRRYHISKPRWRHRHIYSEFKKCLSMVILICIKQHLMLNWWKGWSTLRLSWKKTVPDKIEDAWVYRWL